MQLLEAVGKGGEQGAPIPANPWYCGLALGSMSKEENGVSESSEIDIYGWIIEYKSHS